MVKISFRLETVLYSVNSFLTDYWNNLSFGTVTSFFGVKGAFFSKPISRICTNFFSRFRRKHLFITTCIEKQCTRPLRYAKT